MMQWRNLEDGYGMDDGMMDDGSCIPLSLWERVGLPDRPSHTLMVARPFREPEAGNILYIYVYIYIYHISIYYVHKPNGPRTLTHSIPMCSG